MMLSENRLEVDCHNHKRMQSCEDTNVYSNVDVNQSGLRCSVTFHAAVGGGKRIQLLPQSKNDDGGLRKSILPSSERKKPAFGLNGANENENLTWISEENTFRTKISGSLVLPGKRFESDENVVYIIVVKCFSKTPQNQVKAWYVLRSYADFRHMGISMLKTAPELRCSICALPKNSFQLPGLTQFLNIYLRQIILSWKILRSRPDKNHGEVALLHKHLVDFLTEHKQNLSCSKKTDIRPGQFHTTCDKVEKARLLPDAVSMADFEALKVIGIGSFGRVYLAKYLRKRSGDQSKHETDIQNLVAIKVLEKKEISRRNQLARIETEQRCMALCSGNPFIAKLNAAFVSDEFIYLVQDFCDAGEMYYHLQAVEKFEPEIARFFAAECALALEHIHSQGIVFRDLKPENVMLCSDGHIKLVDFGLSATGISRPNEGSLSYVGTLHYFSPEMIQKKGHGFSVDWWSLGMLLYEMLTGWPPWYSDNRIVTIRSILHSQLHFPSYIESSATRSILSGLLVKNPLERLGSCHGSAELRSHQYFEGVDFEKLAKKQVKSPYVAQMSSLGKIMPLPDDILKSSISSMEKIINPAEEKENIDGEKIYSSFTSFAFSECDL